MEFDELVNSVTDETLKASLKDAYKKVNQQKGEYGQKLIEKDNSIKELTEKQKSYAESFDTLKKLKIEPSQIPGILEKLNIQKTKEEEYELTKAALDETQKSKTTLEKEIQRFKAEKAIKGFFDKERAEFKDDKGQTIKLADRFINFEKLYDVQDLTNETVLKEKCKQVLTESFATQTEVARDLGFQGTPTHKTPDGEQKKPGEALSIKEVYDKHGPAAAIHAAREAQNKK